MNYIITKEELSGWTKECEYIPEETEEDVSCKLFNRNFNGMEFEEESSFAGARFDMSNLSGCKLDNVDFSNADFRGADLSNATVEGCNFSGANFEAANTQGIDFSKANLTGVVGDRRYIKSLHINRDFPIAYTFDTVYIGSKILTYEQCRNISENLHDPEFASFNQKYGIEEPKFLIEIIEEMDPAVNPSIPNPKFNSF